MSGKCVNSISLTKTIDALIKTIAAPYYIHTYLCSGWISMELTPPSVDEMMKRYETIKSMNFPYVVAEKSNSCGRNNDEKYDTYKHILILSFTS